MTVVPLGEMKVGLRVGADRVGAVAVSIAIATADLLREFQDAKALRDQAPGAGLVSVSYIYGGAGSCVRVTLKIEACTAEDVEAARNLTHKRTEGSA